MNNKTEFGVGNLLAQIEALDPGALKNSDSELLLNAAGRLRVLQAKVDAYELIEQKILIQDKNWLMEHAEAFDWMFDEFKRVREGDIDGFDIDEEVDHIFDNVNHESIKHDKHGKT